MQKPQKFNLESLFAKHKIAIIVAIGIVVRLILMPITAHPGDMYVWYTLSKNIVSSGPLSVPLFPPVNNYFILIPSSYVYDWLSTILLIKPEPITFIPPALIFYPELNPCFVPDFLFNIVIKLPNLLADIACAVILYKTSMKLTSNTKLSISAAIVWLLNPYLIWISSSWGMWDSVGALFSLLCLYFLMERKLLTSSICLLIGISVKLYPLFFVVPILFYLIGNNSTYGRKDIAKYFAVLMAGLLLLVFTFKDNIIKFVYQFLFPNPAIITNSVANPIAFGLTYWSLTSLDQLLNYSLKASNVLFLSWSLMIASFAIVCWQIRKITKKAQFVNLIFSMILMLSAFFLSYRLVLEQWFVWLLPFLVILYSQKRIDKSIFWGISLLALLYSLLNCPFPFFFLPLAPSLGQVLLNIVYAFWSFWTIRIVALSIIGCLFSLTLLMILYRFRKKATG